MAIGFAMSDEAVQHTRIPGIVSVRKREGQFRTWSLADIARDEMEERADGAEAAETGQRVSLSSYATKTYAVKRQLAPRQIDDYGSMREAEEEVVLHLTQKAYLKIAKLFSTKFMGTGDWTNQSTPGTTWDNTSGTPLSDIRTRFRAIETRCRRRPNVLFMGAKCFDNVSDNSEVTARYSNTDGNVTETMLARLFKVDRVIRIGASENTAQENESASMSLIDSRSALLAYVDMGNSKNAPSAMKVFSYDNIGGMASKGFPAGAPRIRKWFDNDTKSYWYEAEIDLAFHKTADSAGHLFLNAVGA